MRSETASHHSSEGYLKVQFFDAFCNRERGEVRSDWRNAALRCKKVPVPQASAPDHVLHFHSRNYILNAGPMSTFFPLIDNSFWLQRLLVIFLLLGLKSGHSDTVQITLTGLGDAATSLILILLEDTNLLKRLHDLAVNGAGGVNVVRWARATVLWGSMDLSETANTDGLAHVDVAGNGSGADVEPGWSSQHHSHSASRL